LTVALAVGAAPAVDVRLGTTAVAAVHLGGEKVWPTRSGFQPTDVPDCALWLDADDPATLTVTGQDVTAWTDKSTRSTPFNRQLGPTPPTTGGLVNGRNAVRFTNGGLATADLPAPVSPQGLWDAFAVVTAQDLSGVRTILDGDGYTKGSATRVAQFMRTNGGRVEAIAFPNAVSDSGPQVPLNTPTILRAARSASNLETFVDGQSDGPRGPLSPTGETASTVMSVGAYDVDEQFWSGSICEAIIYARALTTQEATAVDTYLRTKWGIA
jgi:hypothetical protein